MSKLVTLITQLGSNAALLKAYEQDPEGIMTLAGLSDNEKQLIKDGDVEKISELTGLKSVVMTHKQLKCY